MNFLLDTNVVSEWVKPRPTPAVAKWLAVADEDRVFLSVITIAELRFGLETIPAGARRELLEHWLKDDLPIRFEGRILDVSVVVADAWGILMARSRHSGAAPGAVDGFIAATAMVHGLTIVTRNTRDFAALGIPLVNPWEAS